MYLLARLVENNFLGMFDSSAEENTLRNIHCDIRRFGVNAIFIRKKYFNRRPRGSRVNASSGDFRFRTDDDDDMTGGRGRLSCHRGL